MIRADLTEKKQLLNKASLAIGNLRQVNFNILLKCKYGHPYSKEKQESMRWTADQKVIDSFALMPYVFDDNVFEKVKKLIQFSYNIKDICDYKGNFDDEVLIYKKDIFDDANKLIKEDHRKN